MQEEMLYRDTAPLTHVHRLITSGSVAGAVLPVVSFETAAAGLGRSPVGAAHEFLSPRRPQGQLDPSACSWK